MRELCGIRLTSLLDYGVEQLVLTNISFVKAQLLEQGFLFSNQASHGPLHAICQVLQLIARRRRLQVFDDAWFEAGGANGCQGIARCSAVGIVIDRDLHGVLPMPFHIGSG